MTWFALVLALVALLVAGLFAPVLFIVAAVLLVAGAAWLAVRARRSSRGGGAAADPRFGSRPDDTRGPGHG